MKAPVYNMAKSDIDPLRTPYEIDDLDFPRGGDQRKKFAFLLGYAILAPSSHNSQPWKFKVFDEGVAVYADYTRRLPIADPGNRELLMSVGAAIMNVRIASAYFGFDCRVDYNYSADSEGPIAFAHLSPKISRDEDDPLVQLFPYIPKRHTNRHPFLAARVPERAVQVLKGIGNSGKAQTFFSVDGALNVSVANLVAEADRLQQADPTYRKELAEWVRPNWTQKPDGITGAAMGINGLASAVGPWATRRFDFGRIQAERDRNLCAQAPLLVVIHGEDSVPDLLDAGELLERLFLAVTQLGMYCSFFNIAIEVPDLRLKLRHLLDLPMWPQLLLRVGFSLSTPVATPRRQVEEVLIP